MEYIYVGRIITTHGLNGEMKIRSNFKYKDQAFKVGNKIYIGLTREEHEITVDTEIASKALKCIDRMLEVSAIGAK